MIIQKGKRVDERQTLYADGRIQLGEFLRGGDVDVVAPVERIWRFDYALVDGDQLPKALNAAAAALGARFGSKPKHRTN